MAKTNGAKKIMKKKVRDARIVTREVAASMAADAVLVPYFAELFAGLDALESMPLRVSNVIAKVAEKVVRGEDGAVARVLDLGGGKGAVAVELARRFGCAVEMVDACPAFVEHANALAQRRGLEKLVMARVGDIEVEAKKLARQVSRQVDRQVSGGKGAYDAAIMLNVWNFERAAPALRRLVKPGGVYVMDDAVLSVRLDVVRAFDSEVGDEVEEYAWEFADVPTRDDVAKLIAAQGDHVLAEVVVPRRALKVTHTKVLQVVTRNGNALARREPKLKKAIDALLTRQREAGDVLLGPLQPVVWVVQRRSGRGSGRVG